MYLPLELQNYIFSFLPILSNEQKRLNHIVNNYNVYFERELIKQFHYNEIYLYWLNKHPDIKEFVKTSKLTMVQMQKLYKFSLLYIY